MPFGDLQSGPSELGKAEDTASASGDVGVAAMTKRQDTPTTDTSDDGDYQPQKTDSAGRLWVNASGVAVPVTDNGGSLTVDGTVTANQGTAAAGSGAWPVAVTNTADTVVKPGDATNNAIRVNVVAGAGGGVSHQDETSFTEGTSSFTPVGGVFNDTITSDPTEDQAATFRITAKRALHVNLRDAGGNEIGDSSANPVVVGDGGATISIDDAAGSITIDNATLSTTGGGTETGALRVTIANNSTGLVSVDDNGTTLSVDDGAGSLTVDGTVSVSSVTPSTGSTNLGKARDASGGASDTGVAVWGWRHDTAGLTPVSAEQDYSPISVDKRGRPMTAAGWYLPNAVDQTIAYTAASQSSSLTIDGAGGITVQLSGTYSGFAMDFFVNYPSDSSNNIPVLAQRADATGKLEFSTGTLTDTTRTWWIPIRGAEIFRTSCTALVSGTANLKIWRTGNNAQSYTTIMDGDGSITVDAPVATPVNVQVGDGTRTATVRDTGSSDSLNVSIVDASGNQITSFGGGAQFAEDAASASGDLGTVALTTRQDTPSSTTDTDGDYQPLKTDSTGRLWVRNQVFDVAGGGSEGGALRVTIANDSTGLLSVDDNGGSLTIDGTVTANLAAGSNNIGDVDVLSVIPGTGATNLGKAEDAGHTTGDTGVMALAVCRANPIGSTLTDADYATLNVDAAGRLYAQSVGAQKTIASDSIVSSSTTVAAIDGDCYPYSTYIFSVQGTYAGVNFTFEGSFYPGVWVGITPTRLDGSVTEGTSGVLPANTVRAWVISIPGLTNIRVRATAYTSGSAAVRIDAAPGTTTVVSRPETTTASHSSITSSASSVTLLAANPARKLATIYNDSTQNLYVRWGATASTSNFHVLLIPGAYLEVPGGYTGVIDGIWASANGFARVGEMTS